MKVVVSPTHRPPLPLRKYSWYWFMLEAESTPRSLCGRKDYVNEKFHVGTRIEPPLRVRIQSQDESAAYTAHHPFRCTGHFCCRKVTCSKQKKALLYDTFMIRQCTHQRRVRDRNQSTAAVDPGSHWIVHYKPLLVILEQRFVWQYVRPTSQYQSCTLVTYNNTNMYVEKTRTI